MTETIKVLAQGVPSVNVLTNLYTVPPNTSVVISSIIICNMNAINEIRFRVSIAVGGASDSQFQYIYYDMPLTTNDTFIVTSGITLAANDILRVYSDTINVSFSLYGTEITS